MMLNLTFHSIQFTSTSCTYDADCGANAFCKQTSQGVSTLHIKWQMTRCTQWSDDTLMVFLHNVQSVAKTCALRRLVGESCYVSSDYLRQSCATTLTCKNSVCSAIEGCSIDADCPINQFCKLPSPVKIWVQLMYWIACRWLLDSSPSACQFAASSARRRTHTDTST